MKKLFTSESVTEGHPDKLCDYISDSILDAYLELDPNSRVGCEVVAGKNKVEHEGRLWSLSAFCGTYLPENMHNKSEAYQGPKYFSYNGKTLWNIRLGNEGKE